MIGSNYDKIQKVKILHDIETFAQSKWEKDRIFEVDADVNKTVEKCFVTTPMPYGDSRITLNRGYTWFMTDVYCNFKAMKGKKVLVTTNFHFGGPKTSV
jgi:leucyl-tRNA synthetase